MPASSLGFAGEKKDQNGELSLLHFSRGVSVKYEGRIKEGDVSVLYGRKKKVALFFAAIKNLIYCICRSQHIIKIINLCSLNSVRGDQSWRVQRFVTWGKPKEN